MTTPAGEPANDLLQVQRCLRGDAAALGDLRARLDGVLKAILRSRGASPTEAEDMLADLWGDCVPQDDERVALLEKYGGKCPLQAWLATVATNRWYDAKRREVRGVEITRQAAEAPGGASHAQEGGARVEAPADDALMELLKDSLKAAFLACGPREMVMLRLVFLHGLTQREIVRMLGWNETRVSRALSAAMQQIEKKTLQEVRRRDPWLELTWSDFLELCETRQIGFS
ncbi:MAG: RNA polymerase sigma factor [Verrucomicrobiota bacterium]|jgi:RNA polymerase sigma factor (sigma-70 family)